jgi:hypothetical protein
VLRLYFFAVHTRKGRNMGIDRREIRPLALAILFGSIAQAVAASSAPLNVPDDRMPSVIQQFTADRRSLSRDYPLVISESHAARFENSCRDERSVLAAMDFDSFSQEDKVDDLLLKNRLTTNLHQIPIEKRQIEQIERLHPFEKTIQILRG